MTLHMETLVARKIRLAWCTVLVLSSGCAVEHPSVSMDSISKRPFFGLQVVPKKKDGPVYDRPIALDRPAEMRTAGRSAKSVPVQTAMRESESERKRSSWLTLPAAKPVVPLPRTDLSDSERSNQSTPAEIEF